MNEGGSQRTLPCHHHIISNQGEAERLNSEYRSNRSVAQSEPEEERNFTALGYFVRIFLLHGAAPMVVLLLLLLLSSSSSSRSGD